MNHLLAARGGKHGAHPPQQIARGAGAAPVRAVKALRARRHPGSRKAPPAATRAREACSSIVSGRKRAARMPLAAARPAPVRRHPNNAAAARRMSSPAVGRPSWPTGSRDGLVSDGSRSSIAIPSECMGHGGSVWCADQVEDAKCRVQRGERPCNDRHRFFFSRTLQGLGGGPGPAYWKAVAEMASDTGFEHCSVH
jgi:hypothetical protein